LFSVIVALRIADPAVSYLFKFAHRPVLGMDDEASVLAHQRHLLITDLPEEVDRPPRRKIQRELQLVRCHLCLQRQT